MFSYLFTFRSQTQAQSARLVLHDNGLRTQLRRAPQAVSGLGCAWGVWVKAADGVRAAALLRGGAAAISGIYRVYSDGYLEEAAL